MIVPGNNTYPIICGHSRVSDGIHLGNFWNIIAGMWEKAEPKSIILAIVSMEGKPSREFRRRSALVATR
jgi:hypothetical protein